MEAGPVGWAQNWAQRRFATVGTRSTTPANPIAEKQMIGGRGGTRTPDPLLAKQVLCQLSYTPGGATRPS